MLHVLVISFAHAGVYHLVLFVSIILPAGWGGVASDLAVGSFTGRCNKKLSVWSLLEAKQFALLHTTGTNSKEHQVLRQLEFGMAPRRFLKGMHTMQQFRWYAPEMSCNNLITLWGSRFRVK
jgi:hypothetical protein